MRSPALSADRRPPSGATNHPLRPAAGSLRTNVISDMSRRVLVDTISARGWSTRCHPGLCESPYATKRRYPSTAAASSSLRASAVPMPWRCQASATTRPSSAGRHRWPPGGRAPRRHRRERCPVARPWPGAAIVHVGQQAYQGVRQHGQTLEESEIPCLRTQARAKLAHSTLLAAAQRPDAERAAVAQIDPVFLESVGIHSPRLFSFMRGDAA